MIVLRIINPQPNKELVMGSEITLRIINSSPNLVLNMPIQLQYVLDVNEGFNTFGISNGAIPVPVKVKAKEYTELPNKLNPLVFYDLTLIVLEDAIVIEDFTKYLLFLGIFLS